jgi:hypothetical protein
MPQCQAKAKSTGIQCNRSAVSGKRVCTVHGGLTPSGIASPNFKTGKYSKFLPDKLSARYEEALEDTELLTLKSEVALIDSRLTDILENIQSDDTRSLWIDLQSAWERYRNAPNDERRNTELYNIEDLIEKGSKVYHQWNEIYVVLEQRRKLVESERKRYLEMNQVVTADRLMVLISALLGIIKEHVSDTRTLQAISTDFRRLSDK